MDKKERIRKKFEERLKFLEDELYSALKQKTSTLQIDVPKQIAKINMARLALSKIK